MSDLAGIYQWHGTLAVSAAQLQKMQSALNWYHAAQSGLWHQDHCGLTQISTPFSAEDLHDQQPLSLPDADIHLVAVARLDHRDALCDALDLPARVCSETPDSALILKAYLRWGETCASRLRGDFAFALWDGKKQTLLCARDQRGVVPFFYHHAPGKRLSFATSMQGVLAAPGVPSQLDQQMLADRLTCNGGHEHHRTFFQDIHLLPPSHYLVASSQGLRIAPYWQHNPRQRVTFRRDEDYVDAFREVFFAAIHSRMRGLHPVGAHFSGGLDSSSVAAVAALQLKEQGVVLPTFTQVPSDHFHMKMPTGISADDRHLIDAFRQQHDNIASNLVNIDAMAPDSNLEQFFEWSHIPPLNPFNRLWLERIYQKAAQQGLGALLTGESGNRTVSLSGKATRIDRLIRQGHWLTLWRELTLHARITGQSPMRLIASHLHRWTPLGSLLHQDEFQQRDWRSYSLIHPAFAERMKVDVRLEEIRQQGLQSPEVLLQRMEQRLRYARNQTPLYAHAYGNAFGVRSLDPTGDLDVVEFCLSVPVEQHFHQGWDRALIRRAMDPYLPAQIIWRTDRGRQAADWMLCLDKARTTIADDLEAMSASALAAEVLDVPAMIATLKSWRSGSAVYQNPAMLFHTRLMRAWLVGRFILWSERRRSVMAAAA